MSLLAHARALAPTISARAAEIEATRRLPTDLARDIADRGLFRMVAPAAVGGGEAAPGEILACLETLAAADASVGWCVMIGATTGLIGAYLPRETAAEIFADPRAITGGVFAPLGRAVPEANGYRVSGRWRWASGSQNCAWLAGGCQIVGEDPSKARMMVAPAADVRLVDTWQVAGLSGTGSGDMEMTDLFVPRTRSVSLTLDRPWADGPLYAFPAFGLLAMGIAAVALGNARGALDDLHALASSRKVGGRAMTERSTVQASVALAEARWRAARAFLFEAAETAFAGAAARGALEGRERALLRLAATHAARESAEVARAAYDLGGGAALFLDSPLQRRFRDAHACTQHVMIQSATLEPIGRALFGLDPRDPTF